MVDRVDRQSTRVVTLLDLKTTSLTRDLVFVLQKIPGGEIWEKGRRNYTGYYETPTRKELLMKKTLSSVRGFISNHRALVASGLTATAFLVLMYRNARQLEGFMKEHNLLDEYNNWLTEGL